MYILINIISIIVILLLSIFTADASSRAYKNNLNKDNLYYKHLMALIDLAIGSIMFISLLIGLDYILDTDLPFNILSFSIIGVIIASLLNVTYNLYSKEEESIAKENEIKAFLVSLKDEININWIRYAHLMENLIKNKEEYILINFTEKKNYRLIYTNNTDKLGKIKNSKLRESIINTYSQFNDLFEQYENNEVFIANNKQELELENSSTKLQHRPNLDLLKIQTNLIRSKHDSLKRQISKVNLLFRKENI